MADTFPCYLGHQQLPEALLDCTTPHSKCNTLSSFPKLGKARAIRPDLGLDLVAGFAKRREHEDARKRKDTPLFFGAGAKLLLQEMINGIVIVIIILFSS